MEEMEIAAAHGAARDLQDYISIFQNLGPWHVD